MNKIEPKKTRGRPKKEKVKVIKKKKEIPLKPYYGIEEVPKGYRQASMIEAIENKKVNYWGLKKIDNKVLEINKKEKVNVNELMVKMAGLRGRLLNLQKQHAVAKTNDEKDKIKTEYDMKKAELAKLNEKYLKAQGVKKPVEKPVDKPAEPVEEKRRLIKKNIDKWSLEDLQDVASQLYDIDITDLDKSDLIDILKDIFKKEKK